MKKILVYAMAAFVVLAVSCKKDKTETLSASEAKTSLNSSTDGISTDLTDLTNSPSFKAMDNLGNVEAPFGNPMKSTSVLLKTQKLKSMKSVQADNFDFEGTKGVWEYDSKTDTVKRTGDNANVVIKFPSDSTKMDVNDATLTLYAYTEQLVIEYDEFWERNDTSYMPTKLTADLVVGTTKCVDIKMLAAWTTDGKPSMFDVTATVDVYSMSVKYTEAAAKQSLVTSIKKSNAVIIATGVTLTYPSATDRSKPDFFEGFIQARDIKVSGSANMKIMDAIEQPMAADFNNNVKLSINRASDGAKIGDIKGFDEAESDPYTVATTEVVGYIVYSDGTKEKAQVYMDKLQESMPDNIALK